MVTKRSLKGHWWGLTIQQLLKGHINKKLFKKKGYFLKGRQKTIQKKHKKIMFLKGSSKVTGSG
jgi:hypothetical protein